MNLGVSEHTDLGRVWERVCTKFSFSNGNATYNSWLKPLQISRFDAGVVYLTSPSRFIKDWVYSNFSAQLENLFRSEIHSFLGFSIIVENKISENIQTEIPQAPEENKIAKPNYIESVIDDRLRFENFIVAESNNFSFSSAKAIAEGTNIGCNTLFIYGGVGSGKTHLLQSICAYIKAHQPEKNVIYLSAEKFMFQFVKAIRERDMVSFKEALRSTDILLIDDIQFICGKLNIQEEFIHTFNAIVDNGKQIVLSANCAPSDLADIDERIKSRLGWGLVADIKKSDADLRFKILQSKVKLMGAEVDETVLHFLADNITTNIRELEGALIKLVAQSRIMGNEVTTQFASETLKDLLRYSKKEITIDEIKRTVCTAFDIRISDIESAKRDRKIARPRQVAMYLAKNFTTKSLPEIGRNFGSKNHTTVIHAVKTIEKLKTSEPDLGHNIEQITRTLAG